MAAELPRFLRWTILRSDLPLGRDASSRFLPWLIGVMVYLAALSLAAAMAVDVLVDRWQEGLQGTLTVQIPRQQDLDPAQRNARIQAAVGALMDTPGVATAEPLDEDAINQLLEPWLGSGSPTEDLPLPDLIAVTLGADAQVDLAALRQRLTGAVADAILDDHARWLADIVVFARSVQVVAGMVVVLIGLSAGLTVIFVTRTGLAIHKRVIEIVHLIGAHDAYIARQFQMHAVRLGLMGGLIGVAGAAATLLVLQQLLRRIDATLLPTLSLSGAQWLAVAVLPLVAAGVALVTARITVMQALQRL